MTQEVAHLSNADILEAEQGDSIEAKLALRKAAAQAYGEGTPIMTDDAFDALVAELNLEDAEVGHGFQAPDSSKVSHKFRMLSLTKVHEYDEIAKWMGTLPEGIAITVQAKYDGGAIELVYAEGTGQLISGSTRGNGSVGEDVTHTVLAMAAAGRIPSKVNIDLDEEIHVYGEIIMTQDDLDTLNEENKGGRTYSNVRNAATGITRRTDSSFAKYLSLVAYDVSFTNSADDMAELKEQGFTVPTDHFKVHVTEIDEVWDAIEALGKARDSFGFDTDGAVIKVDASREDRNNIGATSTVPKWAIAFKYPNTYKETTMRGVSWGVGRTGQVTPTAQFDTVNLGTNVSDATMHNFAQFFNWQFAPGDIFKITRSGEVIPYIGEIVERSGEEKFKAPTNCPNCNEELFLSDSESHLYCPSLGECATDLNIVYSLQSLGVKGVSHALVRRLLDEGIISNFLDILNIENFEDQIAVLPGYGETSARKAVEAIDVVWDQPLQNWIAAMGIRNISFGSASILEENFNSLAEIAAIDELEDFNLADVPDFGAIKAQAVLDAKDKFLEWNLRLALEHDFTPERYEVEVTESQFTGKAVIVTGSLPRAGRDEAKSWLVEHGAILKSGISKNVDIVVIGENAGPAKMVQIEKLLAQGLIEVMDAEVLDRLIFGE